MVELEKEINRQIALSLAKKRGPYAKYAKGLVFTSYCASCIVSNGSSFHYRGPCGSRLTYRWLQQDK
jgi:hypothetical protein